MFTGEEGLCERSGAIEVPRVCVSFARKRPGLLCLSMLELAAVECLNIEMRALEGQKLGIELIEQLRGACTLLKWFSGV